MTRQYKTIIGFAILISFFLLLRTYYLRSGQATQFVEKIRKEIKPGFDSLQNAIYYENELNDRIKKNISEGNFEIAIFLLDSLPPFGKKERISLYRGMILHKQKKYQSAIDTFSALIAKESSPIAYQRRAEVYSSLQNWEAALYDYRQAYLTNYDYSINMAEAFAAMKKIDSAIYYYQIYLEHYPKDSSALQKKINLETDHPRGDFP